MLHTYPYLIQYILHTYHCLIQYMLKMMTCKSILNIQEVLDQDKNGTFFLTLDSFFRVYGRCCRGHLYDLHILVF